MFRSLRFGFTLILSLALAALPAFADAPAPHVKSKVKNPPPPPLVPLHKPIVAKWTTLDGMRYYQNGFMLDSRLGPTLSSVIYPLNDPQASELLQKSQKDETLGLVGTIGGGGLFLTGLLTADYNQQTQRFTVTPGSAILTTIGLVAEVAGVFWLEESDTSKFAAVQRYNQIVRGEDDPSVENWKAVRPADLSVAFNF